MPETEGAYRNSAENEGNNYEVNYEVRLIKAVPKYAMVLHRCRRGQGVFGLTRQITRSKMLLALKCRNELASNATRPSWPPGAIL